MGNLSCVWGTEEQNQEPEGWLLTSAFPVAALGRAARLCKSETVCARARDRDKVPLSPFVSTIHLLHIFALIVDLVSMLMVYQNLIRADEMNRNKVLKYLKMNHLSYAKSGTIWSGCHLGHHCSCFKKRTLEGGRSK